MSAETYAYPGVRIGCHGHVYDGRVKTRPRVEAHGVGMRLRKFGAAVMLVAGIGVPLTAALDASEAIAKAGAQRVATTFSTEQQQRSALEATHPMYTEVVGRPHTQQDVAAARNTAAEAHARYETSLAADEAVAGLGALALAGSIGIALWERRKKIKAWAVQAATVTKEYATDAAAAVTNATRWVAEAAVTTAWAAWENLNEPLPPTGDASGATLAPVERYAYIPPQPMGPGDRRGVYDAGIPAGLEPEFYY